MNVIIKYLLFLICVVLVSISLVRSNLFPTYQMKSVKLYNGAVSCQTTMSENLKTQDQKPVQETTDLQQAFHTFLNSFDFQSMSDEDRRQSSLIISKELEEQQLLDKPKIQPPIQVQFPPMDSQENSSCTPHRSTLSVLKQTDVQISYLHKMKRSDFDHMLLYTNNVYPHPYELLISNDKLCSNQETIDYIIVTPTRPSEYLFRDVIRRTWGMNRSYQGLHIRHVFMMGVEIGSYWTTEQLLEEQHLYGDLVQYDYVNSFFNSTVQSLLGMQWVTEHCSNAKYYIKANTDTYVNIEAVHHALMKTLSEFSFHDIAAGSIIASNAPIRYMTPYYCPPLCFQRDYFYPYLQGSFYVFSYPTMKRILEASKTIVPRTHLEDIYFSIVMHDLNIQLLNPFKFTELTEETNKNEMIPYMSTFDAVHHVDPYKILKIHGILHSK